MVLGCSDSEVQVVCGCDIDVRADDCIDVFYILNDVDRHSFMSFT